MSDDDEEAERSRDQFGVCCICDGRYDRTNILFYDDDGLCPPCANEETA
jgi:hypothetical protein